MEIEKKLNNKDSIECVKQFESEEELIKFREDCGNKKFVCFYYNTYNF